MIALYVVAFWVWSSLMFGLGFVACAVFKVGKAADDPLERYYHERL